MQHILYTGTGAQKQSWGLEHLYVLKKKNEHTLLIRCLKFGYPANQSCWSCREATVKLTQLLDLLACWRVSMTWS